MAEILPRGIRILYRGNIWKYIVKICEKPSWMCLNICSSPTPTDYRISYLTLMTIFFSRKTLNKKKTCAKIAEKQFVFSQLRAKKYGNIQVGNV